jgi:hypothetical protein
MTLMPIVAQTLSTVQDEAIASRRTTVLTTLFLHVTSAIHLLNQFRLTRNPALTRDATGSLVLAALGAYIAVNGTG